MGSLDRLSKEGMNSTAFGIEGEDFRPRRREE